jgi:signal transduction histidine kinase
VSRRAAIPTFLRAAAALLLLAATFAVRADHEPGAPARQGEVVEIRTARARIQVDGEDQPRVADVRLPFHLDREARTRPAQAEFRMAFDAPAGLVEPYGLYFPRVGNLAEVYVNGTLIKELGELAAPDGTDYSKAPQYMTVPARLLQPHNELRVVVVSEGGRRGGLSSVFVGPDDLARPIYDRASMWRMTASMAVSVFSVLVGTIALVLWATQTEPGLGGWRRDRIYLAAGLAEFCWALRVGDVFIEHPPLPWPAWGVLVTAAFAGWFCCIAIFCQNAGGWNDKRVMKPLLVAVGTLFVASFPASWLSYSLHEPLYLTAWLGAANAIFVVYAIGYLLAAIRQPTRARLLVGIFGALNVAVGVRDWVAIRIGGDYSESTWIRYSSVLFGVVLVSIVVSRFREATAQARELNATLAERVAQRERALADTYAELERMAREQERAAERTRILRDMHDGVGSHLSAAIRQMESGRGERHEVLQTLRDALDQLKLSIDAMNLPPGDVNALLAGMRYRLQPRFAASDIDLQWAVQELPPLPGLDAAAMRHLQFILFEALSNVLQHAGAHVLRIEARPQEGGVLLRIVDDGRGFDVATQARGGLRAMRDRADAIGAKLAIASVPGRTEVALVLPS